MNPEEMIREAQARGLTRNPTLILDVAPGESPAETIARMQRATEFVSGEEMPTPDGEPLPSCTYNEDGSIATLFGKPVIYL